MSSRKTGRFLQETEKIRRKAQEAAEIGKLNLRIGTGWRTFFFNLFRPPWSI